MRSCTGRGGPARPLGSSPPSLTLSTRPSWTVCATGPSVCSQTRRRPRVTNPTAVQRNSISEAKHSSGRPAESTGEAIMSLPKPSNQAAVVITGASSGIGTELARGLPRRGYPLVLVARRQDRLDELADDLRAQYTVGVDVLPLDLSDAGSREQLAERLRSEPIAGLCNSAGFGTSGVFQTLPIERESEEVVLNSLALMELTHAALPGMVERGAGAVLNIASIAGFQPMPYMAVYSATKAFVQTFSEAVHEELTEQACRSRCCARALCRPSGARSPMP